MKVQQIARRGKFEECEEAILRILKLRAELSVTELCQALKLTHTAVRRHLARLAAQELITLKIHPQSKGRPIHKYSLARKAAVYFPSGYEQMLADLLNTVFETGGHVAVMDFLKANFQRQIAILNPQYMNRTLQERVLLLAEYFSLNGYMTAWKKLPAGKFYLYHQNCAIYSIAVAYRQCCILEPRLMESLLQAKVTRQQYILKGKPICGYLIESS